MQDPERFLKEQSIQVHCVVHPDKPARIEPKLRAWVNHELYYFSDAKALSSFRKDPLHYCGLVTDPVTRRAYRVDQGIPIMLLDESVRVDEPEWQRLMQRAGPIGAGAAAVRARSQV